MVDEETGVDPGACDPGKIAPDGVDDLAALAGAVAVDGDLELREVGEAALIWLQCLETISGDLTIIDSPTLTTVEHLERLRVVGGSLRIYRNEGLVDLDGLSGLREVGSIWIRHNPALARVSLPDITALYDLVVVHNEALATLELPALTELEGQVFVRGSSVLTGLEGLAALDSVGWDARFRELPALASTEGLSSLRHVGGAVRVRDTPALPAVRLPVLVEARELQVAHADNLVSIEVPALERLSAIQLIGLPRLVTLTGLSRSTNMSKLVISSVPGLETLNDIGSFVANARRVSIFDAPALADLSALSTATEFDREVWLESLPALTSLQDLGQVTSVRALHVSGVGLSTLEGLESLQKVREWAVIRDMSLDDISALAGLTAFGLEIANPRGRHDGGRRFRHHAPQSTAVAVHGRRLSRYSVRRWMGRNGASA